MAFSRYCGARARAWAEERTYRAYVSDALWLYGQGKAHGDRWADRVEPRRGGDPGDARDCDSIIEELRKRGLEVVDDQ